MRADSKWHRRRTLRALESLDIYVKPTIMCPLPTPHNKKMVVRIPCCPPLRSSKKPRRREWSTPLVCASLAMAEDEGRCCYSALYHCPERLW